MIPARNLIRAYQEGKDSVANPHAVCPYTPAEPGSDRQRLAQLWRSGRLSRIPTL